MEGPRWRAKTSPIDGNLCVIDMRDLAVGSSLARKRKVRTLRRCVCLLPCHTRIHAPHKETPCFSFAVDVLNFCFGLPKATSVLSPRHGPADHALKACAVQSILVVPRAWAFPFKTRQSLVGGLSISSISACLHVEACCYNSTW